MFKVENFFKQMDGLPFPEIFAEKLTGFDDITYVWDVLKRLQKEFIKQRVRQDILGTVENGAHLMGDDIYIGKGTHVEAGAMIVGPCIIGEDVEIRHGAYIRGHVLIGSGAVVGHCTEVIRSIFLPGAKAPHFNYVGDSILGSKVNLGAGTKLSNFKNDGTEVKVAGAGTSFKTGLRKFGAILGDGCQLGCNSVTNPGTVMGPNGRVYPNATVSGLHAPLTIIKLRQTLEYGRIG